MIPPSLNSVIAWPSVVVRPEFAFAITSENAVVAPSLSAPTVPVELTTAPALTAYCALGRSVPGLATPANTSGPATSSACAPVVSSTDTAVCVSWIVAIRHCHDRADRAGQRERLACVDVASPAFRGVVMQRDVLHGAQHARAGVD